MDIFLVPVNKKYGNGNISKRLNILIKFKLCGDTSTPTTVNWLLEEQLFRQSAHTKFDCIYWPFSLI